MPSEPRPQSPPSFDRVARLYRWAEYLALGPLLQQTRLALLESVSGCRQALLFGDGDGRFAAHLLARAPELRAVAVDTSAGMLRLLQARCKRAAPNAAERLTAVRASALRTPVPSATDLIVTHFFLDCLSQPDLESLVQKVAASVGPGTLWLLSDFEVPATPLFRSVARIYIRLLYLAFRLLTGLRVRQLPNPQAALAHRGFYRLIRRRKLSGLLYSELWVFRGGVSSEPHNPPMPDHIHNPMCPTPETFPGTSRSPADASALTGSPTDPLPDPEPVSPSLDEPDRGVFHHDPVRTPSPDTTS